MESPLISVIVPVYKVERYLHTCINSVLNQTYKNWELILVDDGSPDKCPQICDEYAQSDSRIKAIHKTNGGVSSARNLGLDIATGNYIAFLDSDDFWHINFLSIMVELCLKHDADIVQCNFIRGLATNFPKTKKRSHIKIFDNHSIFLKRKANVIVCAKLFKSYLFEEIRMPVGKFFEDDFTTWKWYYNANKIIVTSMKLYYYTENDQSTMAGHTMLPRLDFFDAYEERINFFLNKGEKGLEDFSRSHFCKALILTRNNKRLSAEQKVQVDNAFTSNWLVIKHSSYIPLSLKMLFSLFSNFPMLTLRLINIVR